MQKCKIKSCKYVGKKKTYNLTMKSKQHNYSILGNNDIGKFVISANSHAAAYSVMSYQSCYLKANYTDEFIVSLLNVEIERAHYEKIEDLEKNFKKKMNIKFLSRSLNDCGTEYIIEKRKDISNGVGKTEIRPPLLCKSVGYNAAKSISDNAPYKGIRDLAEKTDFTHVTSETIGALIDAGYFKGKRGRDRKEEYVSEFIGIRKDLKALAKKGVSSVDLFG